MTSPNLVPVSSINSNIGLHRASEELSVEKPDTTQLTRKPEKGIEMDIDRGKPYFPLAGARQDGWSDENRATATCFCGAVQLSFPIQGPGLVDTFICNCTDCRKITASMFASNFTVDDTYLIHERGRENLSTYSQSKTIGTGNNMTNYFCSTCGSLMYRVGTGFPGMSILRIGTVDDFSLHGTKLKPRIEQFVKDRVAWLCGAEGVEQVHGFAYA